MRPDNEVILVAYRHFNAREIDSVLELMHPDVDWPNGMDGGRVLGRAAVREYWVRQWAMIDPHVEPVNLAADESGDLVVDVHQIVRNLDGLVLMDRMLQHVYRMRGGLIVQMEIREAAATGHGGHIDTIANRA